jgi:3-hydroxymyristoyl/3-hydroxydecanoyl-(acyl carrier protein) dehydratase
MSADRDVHAAHAIRIAPDHPAFAGHFPGMPILPGAALLDEVLFLLERELALDMTQWQLAAAKFLKPVGPGDELALDHARAEDAIAFTVRLGGLKALTGTLSRTA